LQTGGGPQEKKGGVCDFTKVSSRVAGHSGVRCPPRISIAAKENHPATERSRLPRGKWNTKEQAVDNIFGKKLDGWMFEEKRLSRRL